MTRLLLLSLAALRFSDAVSASPPHSRQRLPNPSSNARMLAPPSYETLEERQASSAMTTCGYKNGDPNQARTADSGFDCRFDTSNGLWGFCPTTVKAVPSCGLAGYCVDAHSCNSGCGTISNRKDITTITWYVDANFVEVALLGLIDEPLVMTRVSVPLRFT